MYVFVTVTIGEVCGTITKMSGVNCKHMGGIFGVPAIYLPGLFRRGIIEAVDALKLGVQLWNSTGLFLYFSIGKI